MSDLIAIDFDEIEEHEDKQATWFKIDGKTHWIPDSQIDRIYYKTKKVYVTEWIAEQKGFV